jgi:hypothetical protein
MAANFSHYMRIAHQQEEPPPTWERGLVEWEGPIVGGIVQQSLAISEIVSNGGITTAGNVCSLQVRFEAESPYHPAREGR